MGHTANDNDKPFEPHADVHAYGYRKEHGDVRPDLFYEKEQRQQCIADDHDPESHTIVSGHPPPEGFQFNRIATVPCHKKFSCIGKPHQQACKDNGLGHIFQDIPGDDQFIIENFPQRNHQGNHHGQSRMDGTGHKIGGEYGGMPAGGNGQGKIP